MSAASHFAQSYREAREKFLAAVEAADLDVESHAHPMLGRDGESLAMDVVLDGSRDASRLLLITSACHGVEGFCGSGIQTAMLHDAQWRRAAADADVAVLYIHALNPYGFSWWRRVTQENVDLNRNFLDFSKPLPPNPAYDDIAGLLVPPMWPPSDLINAKTMRFLQEQGQEAVQAVVSRGQYDHPEGLFYGGRNPTWSNQILRHVLRDHGQRCERLGWIDLHTGLGPNGHGERILACKDDELALARVRAWWGREVTSIYDGSSTSAPLTGLMWLAAYEECAQAEYTGIVLEYGTVPLMEVLNALRGDQWMENHPEADDVFRARVKMQVRTAFYTDEDEWKERVVEQAFDAARGAIRGLNS